MHIFLTGATGFAGSHLVKQLHSAGHDLFALYRSASSPAFSDYKDMEMIAGDVLDLASMKTAVATARPDIIYHLAGQAYTARSWQDPAHTLAINSGGTANLLEAAVSFGRPRVIVVTSAEIYGHVTRKDLPITEATLPKPRHPYGISKLAAGQLAALYWQRYQLPVIEARPFNHIGPGQALGFVVPDFASQIARIKLGLQSPRMLIGNLDAQRDFTDVRDVVRAYQLLATSGKPGETYLINSGQPVAISYLLATLAEMADVPVEIEYDPQRMRPSDIPCLYGSYDKLLQDTGWKPEIHIRQSLADSLAEWIERSRADG